MYTAFVGAFGFPGDGILDSRQQFELDCNSIVNAVEPHLDEVTVVSEFMSQWAHPTGFDFSKYSGHNAMSRTYRYSPEGVIAMMCFNLDMPLGVVQAEACIPISKTEVRSWNFQRAHYTVRSWVHAAEDLVAKVDKVVVFCLGKNCDSHSKRYISAAMAAKKAELVVIPLVEHGNVYQADQALTRSKL